MTQVVEPDRGQAGTFEHALEVVEQTRNVYGRAGLTRKHQIAPRISPSVSQERTLFILMREVRTYDVEQIVVKLKRPLTSFGLRDLQKELPVAIMLQLGPPQLLENPDGSGFEVERRSNKPEQFTFTHPEIDGQTVQRGPAMPFDRIEEYQDLLEVQRVNLGACDGW